jgi:hypothetical protein
MDLSDKEVGSCNLYDAIGIKTKLNAYFNQNNQNSWKEIGGCKNWRLKEINMLK